MRTFYVILLKKMRWKYVLLFFYCFVFSAFLSQFILSAQDPAILNDFLKETVKQYRIPGLAVAVVQDHEVSYISGFGNSVKGVSITPDTPFLLGSTTKTFTALALMCLIESRQVCLDSAVIKYLPEFRLAYPEFERKITIRNLLNHTSGLSDEGMPYASLGEKSLDQELYFLRKCTPVSPPGQRFEYFNANYRILGLIIERVTGMKYGDYLSAKIFKPLGMMSSFAGPTGVINLARGHGELFGFPFLREQKYRPGALPSGYVVSSVRDISQLLLAELQAGDGDTTILKPESIKLTWQPPENIKGKYAMGWMVFDTIAKTPFLAHGGSLENYQSFFYLNQKLGKGFVFMMNQGGIIPMFGGFSTIRNGLIRIMDGEQPERGLRSLPVVIVISVFLLVSLLELIVTIRLKSWQLRTVKKKKWKRIAGLTLELVFACFLLFWLYKGWSMFYNLLPELFILLFVMIVAGFFRSFIKIRTVVRYPEIIRKGLNS